MKVFLAVFCGCIFCFQSIAQRNCGTSAYDSLQRRNQKINQSRGDLERAVNNRIANLRRTRAANVDSVFTIPIVVHVVYNENRPEQNISDEQIYSQIPVLNEDYRKKAGSKGDNSNPVGADTYIEFCLANLDPYGNPTSGITRHSTTVSGFDYYIDDEKLKAYGYWPSDMYCNIWIADINGYLGYTQFPDNTGLPGLNTTYNTALTDGVAIGYKYFGKGIGTANNPKFNLGRTATHEIGHWLGLKHTWGDELDCSGSDYCDDTPACSGAYYAPFRNCVSPFQCGTLPRQIENYLDYSDDPCMNMFTNDQKTRMRTVLAVSPRRMALKNSLGCKGTTPIVRDSVKVDFYPNPSDGNITFSSLKPISYSIYDLNGVKVYNGTISEGVNTLYFPLASGVYIIELNDIRRKLLMK